MALKNHLACRKKEIGHGYINDSIYICAALVRIETVVYKKRGKDLYNSAESGCGLRGRTGITFTVLEGKIDSSLDDFSSQVSRDTGFGKIVKI